MKNLANCKPTEFLTQTIKIKKYVEHWLSVTKVLEIRKRQPELNEEMTVAEKKEAMRLQARKNVSDMFNSVLEEHPAETLGLLALLCFVDPKDVDEYPVKDYLKCFEELISCDEVIDFFISLTRLDQKGILNTVKK